MKQPTKDSLRKQAEKALSSKHDGRGDDSRPEDKLIHELRVHQIELEMQNDELRQTQARLEELNSKYFDFFQSASLGYFIFDANWTILEANLTGARMLGATEKQIIKKSLHNFIKPEFQDTFHLYSRKLLRSVFPETCELMLKNNMYISIESIAVVDEQGKRTGKIRSVFTGITERKIVETSFYKELELKVEERTKELRSLNESLEKEIAERKRAEEQSLKLNRTLRALSNSSKAMMRAAEESQYLQEICRIIVEDCGHAMVWIGYAEEDDAKSIRPVVHAGFNEGYLEKLKLTWADTARGRGPTGTAIRTGQPSMCQNMLTDPKFKPWREEALKRGYMSSIVLPLLEGKKAFGAITIYSRQPGCFSEDEVTLLTELTGDLAFGITSLRRRAAHTRTEEALRESEERFRTLFNSAHDAVVVTDPTGAGRVVSTNPAACGLFGYSEEEFLDMKRAREVMLDTSDPQSAAFLKQRDEKGKATSELVYRRKDGTCFKGEVSSASFLDMNGNRLAVAIIRDITERKRAEEEIKQRTADLESANAELEGFSYTISHDLRSPLRAIDGFTRMLLKDIGAKLDPESMRRFNVISRSAQKMSQLINDLLSYSRTGRTAISRDKIDMKVLVENIWKELQAGNPDRDMELKIKALPPATGDRMQMRQVVSNLLGNAVKFTRGREHAIIEVSGSKSGGFNTYFIKDNGAGFDMQYYDKLFEIFSRLHSDKDHEGTGVGLAIVKKIIERHGGKVWAEGKPGEGAIFCFTLPAGV
jgi:PAS domain S-box-containing protein